MGVKYIDYRLKQKDSKITIEIKKWYGWTALGHYVPAVIPLLYYVKVINEYNSMEEAHEAMKTIFRPKKRMPIYHR